MDANRERAARPALLVIVRHAESERNAAKKDATYFADEAARSKIKGIGDHKIAITKEGKAQARRTGIALKKRFGAFDYAYTSGYRRTEETLEGILRAYTPKERRATEVRRNPFIRERDPGYTYDMTQEEAERHFPYLREYWQTFGGYMARPPGGESLAQVSERVYLFLNAIFRDRGGKKVLVVTHGGTLRCFRALLERWGYEEATSWPKGQSPKNCGVTTYRLNEAKGRLELEDYNRVY
jgi:broad specificity phosphatase PhoE